MNFKILMLSIIVLCLSTVVCYADNPHMGAWKLNEAKSKLNPGGSKNTMVVYEAAGDMIKVTVDGVDGSGNPIHNEWTGKFDGRDYSVTGDADSDMRAYTKISPRTLAMTNKKDGKVVLTARITVAAYGRTRTVTVSTTDANGTKVTSTAFYDKQ
jgi:hypothetical protein